MAAVSDEAQIFFHYDHMFMEREEDDPKDAILFYYPQSTDVDTQCALCGQLMGVLDLLTSLLGAPPCLFSLTHNKFAIKYLKQYTLALGGALDCPDNVLQLQLDCLYDVFTFYQHSFRNLLQRSSGSREGFVSRLEDIWNCYLAFVRRYDQTLAASFHSLPSLEVTQNHGAVTLQAGQMLKYCQRHHPLCAGCLLYRHSRVYSQLSNDVTFRLLLIQPGRSSIPCQDVTLDFEPPAGVRLIKVYVTREEYAQICAVGNFPTGKDVTSAQGTGPDPSSFVHGTQSKLVYERSVETRPEQERKGESQVQGHLNAQSVSASTGAVPMSTASDLLCEEKPSSSEARSFTQAVEAQDEVPGSDQSDSVVLSRERCPGQPLSHRSRSPSPGISVSVQAEQNVSCLQEYDVVSACEQTRGESQECGVQNATESDCNTESGPLERETERITDEKGGNIPREVTDVCDGSSSSRNLPKGLGGSNIADIMRNVSEKAARGNSSVMQINAQSKAVAMSVAAPLSRSYSADAEDAHSAHGNVSSNQKGVHNFKDNFRFSRSLSLEKSSDAGEILSKTAQEIQVDKLSGELNTPHFQSYRDHAVNDSGQNECHKGNPHIFVSESGKSSEDSEISIHSTTEVENSSDALHDQGHRNVEGFGLSADITLSDADRLSISSAKIELISERPSDEASRLGREPAEQRDPKENTEKESAERGREDEGKEALREMTLFVQSNQDLQVMFFMKPDVTVDQPSLQKLWKDVLRALASMDVLLKSSLSKPPASPQPLAYKYLQYNDAHKTLTGQVTASSNPLQPISAQENQFCDAAVMIHSDFQTHQQLQDITLRNSSSVVYGHRRAAQEVYFRQVLPRHLSVAPSEKDTMLLMDKRAREKLLQDHNISVI